MPIENSSSCLVTARWEWTNTDNPGRWGPEFQAYRYRFAIADGETASYGYSVITTRNKVRGYGRALSLKFRTEAGKDCQLLGWNLEIKSAQEP